MTLEQLAKQGRRKEILTTAFTINQSICNARNETLRNSFVDCEHIKHRNEFVVMRNGVRYINDSAAKSISATWFSIENTGTPTVWIAVAGNDDYEEMIPVVRQHVKAIICIGDKIEPLRSALGCLVRDGIIVAENIEDAVRMATDKATSGDSIIFSPGCEMNDRDMRRMERAFVKMAKE
ncbi:MAG: hypothetical protein IKU05_06740 [Bacteroidales bacterium]|nr:hypothetical protein [Bacteroidales bacterium]